MKYNGMFPFLWTMCTLIGVHLLIDGYSYWVIIFGVSIFILGITTCWELNYKDKQIHTLKFKRDAEITKLQEELKHSEAHVDILTEGWQGEDYEKIIYGVK